MKCFRNVNSGGSQEEFIELNNMEVISDLEVTSVS